MKKTRLGHGEAELGRRVRTQRLAAGMSQQALAGKLGISFQQLQKYEKGANRISVSRMRQIAEHLGVPFSHFVADNAKSEPAALQFASEFMDTARAVRLFRAYTAMNGREQTAFVKLAEQIASARK